MRSRLLRVTMALAIFSLVTVAPSPGGVAPSDLEKESAKIEDDTKIFKFWPVLAPGISIRIGPARTP